MMLTISESNGWSRISAYVAENQIKMAQEARLQDEMAKKVKDVTESDVWNQITTYMSNKQAKMAQEAKLHHKLAGEANLVRVINHTLDQRLDCIYDMSLWDLKRNQIFQLKKSKRNIIWKKSTEGTDRSRGLHTSAPI